MSKKAELIFMKWEADLAEMDRSKPAVEGNFDLLFDQLFRAKLKIDDALVFLDKATKAHYPSNSVIKHTYKKVKQFGQSDSLEDFESSWKSHISKAAKRVFFSIYEIDDSNQVNDKKYGNMSASEYRKQHKYADSHPSIDWEAIIAERDQPEEEETVPVDTNSVNLDINLGDL